MDQEVIPPASANRLGATYHNSGLALVAYPGVELDELLHESSAGLGYSAMGEPATPALQKACPATGSLEWEVLPLIWQPGNKMRPY